MFAVRFRFALALSFPALVSAGDIYGTLREGPSPRGNIEFMVYDNANNPATKRLRTEANGSFRFFLSGNGRHVLHVYYNGEPTAEIFSSSKPAQYDFELVRQQNGSYVLVRR